MRRDLPELASREYDLVVVGGRAYFERIREFLSEVVPRRTVASDPEADPRWVSRRRKDPAEWDRS